MSRSINTCPSCNGELIIRELYCPACDIQIRGSFSAPEVAPSLRLNSEQQAFLRLFVMSRGNLSDVERALGVSYPTVRAKLDDLISKVKGINLEVVIAVGHTDAVGSDAYNQGLSMKRSEAVKAYLVSNGVEKNRVYTEGKGEKQPVADNKTKEGRAKNRRVEIEVVGTRANK